LILRTYLIFCRQSKAQERKSKTIAKRHNKPLKLTIIKMHIKLQPEFDVILKPLGSHAAEFFLAASLYHSRKVSFAKAAHMAGLDFESFKTLLSEHFKQSYIMADECVLKDIHTVEEL